MKIRILTSESSQELEITGSPIFVCVEDKKYVLDKNGSFKKIWSKLTKNLIEMMGERNKNNNHQS